jgi:hypothetical protein
MDLPERIASLKADLARTAQEVPRPTECPRCAHNGIWWNGWCLRSATVMLDEQVVYVEQLRCHRARCAARRCRFGWTVRPTTLVPRRHFQLDVVADALGQYLYDATASQRTVAAAHRCSRRTLVRWTVWVAALVEPATLARRLWAATGAPVLAAGRQVAELGRKALSDARRMVLERASEVLVQLEAVATAESCEPPGLRSLVIEAIAQRDRVTSYACPSLPDLAQRRGPPRPGILGV